MRSYFATLRQLVLPAGAQPGTPRTIIGPDLPPPLDTYLFGGVVKATSAIITYGNSATSYQFLAFVPGTTTASQLYMGWVKTGAVQEFLPGIPYGQSWNLSAGAGVVSMGFIVPTNGASQFIGPVQILTGALAISAGVDTTIGGVSQPRGLVGRARSIAGTGAIGVETVTLTSPAITWVAGRAYEVTEATDWSGSVANNLAFVTLRRNNLAGAVLAAHQVNNSPNVGFGATQQTRTIIVNATAANIVDNIVQTAQAVGGGTVTGAGGGFYSFVRYLEIRDIGAATDYPDAVQI
jgi:hypothetical protein